MGNDNSNHDYLSRLPFGQQLQDFEVVEQDYRQGLKYLEQRITKQDLVLRQISFKEEYQIRNMVTSLHVRQWVLKHPHLFEILRFDRVESSRSCEVVPKVLMLSEYSQRSIDNQTSERFLQRRFYSEEELWTILASCILAFRHLEKHNIRHECLKSSQIFITNDGLIKLKDPITTGTLSNLQYLLKSRTTPHLYLSPQLCESLAMAQPNHTFDPHKSDVFTLGMVMIEIGLLEYQDVCYIGDSTIIDWVRLEDSWTRFRGSYSHHLADILMDCMLQKSPKSRNSWEELEVHIKRIEDQEKSGVEELLETKVKVNPPHRNILLERNISNRSLKETKDGCSQSPVHFIPHTSPRMLERRRVNYHQKAVSPIQQNLILNKSTSPTLQPLRLLKRKMFQPSIPTKTSTRVLNAAGLESSARKRMLQKSLKGDVRGVVETKCLQRLREYSNGEMNTNVVERTVKF